MADVRRSSSRRGASIPISKYAGQQRAVETHRAIIAAGCRLFAAKGFEGCSTRDIATAAGVTHANIRYHFGDKETLWTEVVEFLIAETYRGIDLITEIKSSDNPRKLFIDHTRNVIRYFVYHPELPRIIHFEAFERTDRYHIVREWMRETDAEREAHIKAMQVSGVINPEFDPTRLSTFIGGALTSVIAVNPNIEAKSEDDKEALINQYTELIVALVRA